MIYCLLVLYPASRLDWLVLARLMAGTIFTIPGNVFFRPGHLLTHIHYLVVHLVAPVVILAAAICLITFSVSGRWKLRRCG